jgi:hypothetical protein
VTLPWRPFQTNSKDFGDFHSNLDVGDGGGNTKLWSGIAVSGFAGLPLSKTIFVPACLHARLGNGGGCDKEGYINAKGVFVWSRVVASLPNDKLWR